MSKTEIYPYFDLETAKNNKSADYTIDMENGFRASLTRMFAAGMTEYHLHVTDDHGVKAYHNLTVGGNTETIVNWANHNINKEFPRREVLEQAVEYQQRLIDDHQAILDAVEAELSALDKEHGTPEI